MQNTVTPPNKIEGAIAHIFKDIGDYVKREGERFYIKITVQLGKEPDVISYAWKGKDCE